MSEKTMRAERIKETRQAILAAAERLFAEHGVLAVSNRQIGQAAGQGNNTAVSYHFGTKADLVRAIVRAHTDQIELVRERMLAEINDASNVREWLSCLVRPGTEHLAALDSPTWFSRFSAQVLTEPAFRDLMLEESLGSPVLQRVLDGLRRCLPELPDQVRTDRAAMTRQLIMHMNAECERALADCTLPPHADWDSATTGLVDALVGLWLAPVTTK